MSSNNSFSKLGLGTGMLASLRGGLSFTEAELLLSAAVDHGINLVDTADSYASGECERLLGRLLRSGRDRISLMTKAGYASADMPPPFHRLNPFLKKLKHKFGQRQDFRPEYIASCLRGSLRRLRTDRVEVFLLHDPPAEVLADGRLFSGLSQLKAAGLALRLGISSGDDDVLRLALAWPDCDVVQTPLIEAGGLAESLRNAGPNRPLVVLNHVSLGGCLPGPTRGASPAVRAWQEKVSARARELGVGSHPALLQVALETTGACSVLTGTRNVSHLIENCRAVHTTAPGGYR